MAAAARVPNVVERFVDRCFFGVAPALVGPAIISLGFDHAVAVYVFVLSFLVVFYSSVAKLVSVLVVEGIVQAAWRWFRSALGWAWDWSVDTYRELNKNWIGRSALSLAVAYTAIFWARFLYYNLDVYAAAEATRAFLASIPAYILDWHLLSAALHRWLQAVFSGGFVAAIRAQREGEDLLMQQSPLLAIVGGLLVTALLVGVVVSILKVKRSWRSLIGLEEAPAVAAAAVAIPPPADEGRRRARRARSSDVDETD